MLRSLFVRTFLSVVEVFKDFPDAVIVREVQDQVTNWIRSEFLGTIASPVGLPNDGILDFIANASLPMLDFNSH